MQFIEFSLVLGDALLLDRKTGSRVLKLPKTGRILYEWRHNRLLLR